jgi:PEP-CTERM motif
VSSFGGLLGIPVEPSTFFTDMRNGSDVMFGPDQFGSYAGFPTATDIPYSSWDSFLGLRNTVGADTYYGFAQFAGGDLERYGFETTPNTDIDANFPVAQVPEPSTWAMMMLGFVGTAFLAAKRRRSLRLA